eukprot:g9080.t1 g9080   contig34:800348-800758(-)
MPSALRRLSTTGNSSSSRRPFQDHRPFVPVFQHGAFTADNTIKEAMEGDCGMGSNKKRRVSFPTECGYQRSDSGSDASYNGGGGSSTDFCRSFSDPEGYTTTDSFHELLIITTTTASSSIVKIVDSVPTAITNTVL